jgi:hypothetical protein
MRLLAFFASLNVALGAVACSCAKTVCDCADGPVGLVVTTDAPVTKVRLSGTACASGHFRCIPEKFDDQIHGECKQLQVEAATEGSCIVDLTVGGTAMRIEREMSRSSCTCYSPYFIAANHDGEIDLRAKVDGGTNGEPTDAATVGSGGAGGAGGTGSVRQPGLEQACPDLLPTLGCYVDGESVCEDVAYFPNQAIALERSCSLPLQRAPQDVMNITVVIDCTPIPRLKSDVPNWYYDSDPQAVVIEGSSCDDVMNGDVSRVDIVIGPPIVGGF